MTKLQKISLVVLRLSLGWYMFYAGIMKVLKPGWSAGEYLGKASTFPEVYGLLLHPSVLPVVSFLNAWGLTLIGISLITGVASRMASMFGMCLMVLYYFPVLNFPYVGTNNFLVDLHIIYLIAFLILIAFHADAVGSLQPKVNQLITRVFRKQ
ncbi:MAG TPA: DoxX family protein [Candidatus Paceibacterota bacterium]